MTDPGGARDGASIRTLALEGGFHGRTSRPAQVSDSTACYYRDNLASFRDHNALTVPANDVDALRHLYALADGEGWFIEAFYMEPVMGEGNPGKAVTREFYDAARVLSRAHGSLLVVDSIQAGLRAHGCLSIVDYPGFEDADPPDIETYSKALNAGQYPLSVVAMTPRAAAMYRRGVYGNTMTTNPRALEVAVAVLSSLTGELRANIRARGAELVAKLERVAADLGGPITAVQGTGLLRARVSRGRDAPSSPLHAASPPPRAIVEGRGGQAPAGVAATRGRDAQERRGRDRLRLARGRQLRSLHVSRAHFAVTGAGPSGRDRPDRRGNPRRGGFAPGAAAGEVV